MSPANPITEDSFEKARKAFFETPMAIRKVNAHQPSMPTPETNNHERTIAPARRKETTAGNPGNLASLQLN